MSDSSEPISRSLISNRLARESSHDILLLEVGAAGEEGEAEPPALFWPALEESLLLSAPANNTAAPSVSPVCPSANIVAAIIAKSLLENNIRGEG